VLFGGTVVELLLVNHKEDAVQLIPFFLCALGTGAVLLLLFRPGRAAVWGLRVCMGLVVCGSLFGIYEHFANNLAFQREIQPDAPLTDALVSAVAGGNPLLAPGTLAVAAVLALAATYYHPALENLSEPPELEPV
jgi:fatty acid desaturase